MSLARDIDSESFGEPREFSSYLEKKELFLLRRTALIIWRSQYLLMW